MQKFIKWHFGQNFIFTKNEIKLLILDSLLYLGQNGVISQISEYAKNYLRNDENTAHAILNTIVKLSEDEMAHQQYNANYLKKYYNEGATLHTQYDS